MITRKLQSSPKDQLIRITYSVKGSFTKRMVKEIYPGASVTLKLPYGDLFSQPHSRENTVFIAGGTGITPYLSLFDDPSFADYRNPVLHAGFRNPEMNLYLSELELAVQINPTLIIHNVYQDKDGALDIEKIFQQSDQTSSFFISGPPVMIQTFKSFLLSTGIDGKKLLTDDWE